MQGFLHHRFCPLIVPRRYRHLLPTIFIFRVNICRIFLKTPNQFRQNCGIHKGIRMSVSAVTAPLIIRSRTKSRIPGIIQNITEHCTQRIVTFDCASGIAILKQVSAAFIFFIEPDRIIPRQPFHKQGFILPGIADQKVKMVFHQAKCVDDDPMVCTVLFQVLKEMNIISRLFKNHLFPISPLGNVIIPHFTYRSWLNRHNNLLRYGVHSVYLKQKRLSMAKVVQQHLIQVYQNLVHLYQVLLYHIPVCAESCFIISVLLHRRLPFADERRKDNHCEDPPDAGGPSLH